MSKDANGGFNSSHSSSVASDIGEFYIIAFMVLEKI